MCLSGPGMPPPTLAFARVHVPIDVHAAMICGQSTTGRGGQSWGALPLSRGLLDLPVVVFVVALRGKEQKPISFGFRGITVGSHPTSSGGFFGQGPERRHDGSTLSPGPGSPSAPPRTRTNSVVLTTDSLLRGKSVTPGSKCRRNTVTDASCSANGLDSTLQRRPALESHCSFSIPFFGISWCPNKI